MCRFRIYKKLHREYVPLSRFTDLIAVPDFPAGAMENWGLVIYMEPLMLYNPKQSTVNDRRSIVTVVAHELAHQVQRSPDSIAVPLFLSLLFFFVSLPPDN